MPPPNTPPVPPPTYGQQPNVQPPATDSQGNPVDPNFPGKITIWGIPDLIANSNLWFSTDPHHQIRPAHGHMGHANDPDETSGPLYGPQAVHMTGTQIMQNFAALAFNNPKGFDELKATLWGAGYLGSDPGKVRGGWSDDVQGALSKALKEYYQLSGLGTTGGAGQTAGVGISFMDFLKHQADQNQASGGPGTSGSGRRGPAERPPFSPNVRLTDPATLKSAVQDAATAALGHGLKDDQLDKFVAHFQGLERGAQTAEQQATYNQQIQAYNNQLENSGLPPGAPPPGPASSEITQPDLGSASSPGEALQFAEASDPQGYLNHQAQGYYNALMNMFLPQASARPNTPIAQNMLPSQ